VQEIRLAPLARDDLRQMIVDALRCEPERAAPLAQLVHERRGQSVFSPFSSFLRSRRGAAPLRS